MTVTGYRARAAVRVELDGLGVPRLTRLRSDGPLVLRGRVLEGVAVVHMVGGAAAPCGGDVLELELEVGPGASLEFGSVAASLVHPGPGGVGAMSRFDITASVGSGGTLTYKPEQTVVVAGCDHFAKTAIDLADGARLTWRDELVLGRHGEESGRLESRLDVTVGGRPLLRHGLVVGDVRGRVPGGLRTDNSGATFGGAKTVGSLLLAGDMRPQPFTGPGFAVQPLSGPGVLVTAVAPDTVLLRDRLDEGERLALKG